MGCTVFYKTVRQDFHLWKVAKIESDLTLFLLSRRLLYQDPCSNWNEWWSCMFSCSADVCVWIVLDCNKLFCTKCCMTRGWNKRVYICPNQQMEQKHGILMRRQDASRDNGADFGQSLFTVFHSFAAVAEHEMWWWLSEKQKTPWKNSNPAFLQCKMRVSRFIF